MKNRRNPLWLLLHGLLVASPALGALGALMGAPSPALALSREAIEDLNEAEGRASEVRSLVEKAKYAEARPIAERVLSLRERRLGKDALEVAEALNDLGVILTNIPEFDKAEASLKRALAIREKQKGKEHEYVAITLNNLAVLYIKQGLFPRAEPIYLRAIAIYTKTAGPVTRSTGLATHNLGLLYLRMGDYKNAEEKLYLALSIRQVAYTEGHPAIGATKNALGGLYRQRGEYNKAEVMFEAARAIFEESLSPNHPELAGALNNLGELALKKGDAERAKGLLRRSLEMREKSSGDSHPDVARALDNLAVISIRSGDFEEAEPMVRRAMAIEEKTIGVNHPDYGFALHHLAEIRLMKGQLDEALGFEQKALDIWTKAFGASHPNVANSLADLAEIRRLKGELDEAAKLLRRVFEIREALGQGHPDVASALDAMARVDIDAGRIDSAKSAIARAVAINDRHAEGVLASGSEEQKKAFMWTLRPETDLAITLHALFARTNPEAARLAVSTILNRKGRVLDVMAESVAELRTEAPEDKALLAKLADARRKLSELILKGTEAQAEETFKATARAVELEKERLEAEVSIRAAERASARRKKQPGDIKTTTIDDVQAAIPEGAALVEIALYSPAMAGVSRTKGTKEPARYAAYVLRRGGEVGFADLGPALTIDKKVEDLRPALADRRRDPKPDARALDQIVMAPLRELLKETRWILLSPDGALNLIPFSALVGPDGRYLIETYSFTYLTSGRDLLRRPEASASGPPLLFGNPAFTLKAPPSPSGKAEDPSAAARAVDLSGIGFPPLSGTATEVATIAKEVTGASVFVGPEATEEALKAARGPRILHLATHGFFFDDKSAEVDDGTRGFVLEGSEMSPLILGNPLLRSGLALAGANQRKSDKEDGVLTALEAAGLDLAGTKLVVLSACETGVGETKRGEGVYGLRRALVLAGSEAQVMSLWKVSDSATRDLMVAYYKRLSEGGGRAEAMREVELSMHARADLGRAHPYYWASFIVSGNGSSLDGKLTPPNFSFTGVPKVTPGPRGCACEAAGSSDEGLSYSWGGFLGLAAAGAVTTRSARRRRLRSGLSSCDR